MYFTKTQSGYNIEVPHAFNGYVIVDYISNGSFSSVVSVKKESTNEVFSAKIISVKNMKDTNQMKMVFNEVDILSSIDHPNIVKFYEMLEIQNDNGEKFYAIIEEYCSNGCLLDYMMNNDIKNKNEKKRIAYELIDAINYLHEKGIAHCDIKLENILLDDGLSIKLCDFGLSKDLVNKDNLTKCGSKHYLAPELLTFGTVDFFKSDIWALGITLYAIFEKEFPFNDLYEAACGMLSIKTNDKKLKELISKCTQINPKMRPDAKDLLNSDYFTNFNGEIVCGSYGVNEIVNS